MKIVDKTVAGVVKFGTLNVGDCFKHGSRFFMVIKNDGERNYVNLSKYNVGFFESETLVTHVKAHIVIGGDNE